MVELFRKSSMALALFLLSVSVFAETELKPGEGYERVVPAQNTENPAKVEVIEFFWYGCPHCLQFEPNMNKWAKNLPADVQLIRQPAIFSKKWAPHARAYFIAEALDIVDKVHGDLFDAIQNKKLPLQSKQALASFFAAHGVDKTQFEGAYDSFVVVTKMRQAESMSARYGISGVPAVIINGKYKTSGSLAKTYDNVIKVMNQLIEQERKALTKK